MASKRTRIAGSPNRKKANNLPFLERKMYFGCVLFEVTFDENAFTSRVFPFFCHHLVVKNFEHVLALDKPFLNNE